MQLTTQRFLPVEVSVLQKGLRDTIKKGSLKANVSHERSTTEARAFFRDG